MSERAPGVSDRDGNIRGTRVASASDRPEWKPYVWHDQDAERHAEIQATLARIRTQAARNNSRRADGL